MENSPSSTTSNSLSTVSPTASSLVIDQNHASSIGRTNVTAGDTVKLDLARLSSPTIQILLVDPTNHATVLAQTPILTDSIGLSVKIPDTTQSGDYNLKIQGVEKHEAITVPLNIHGAAATGFRPSQLSLIGGAVLIALAILLILQRGRLIRQK